MKLKLIVPVLFFGMLFVSCHRRGDLHIVINNGNGYYMDIVRGGRIVFTEDTTGIKNISPNGYLSFRLNNKRLRAEYDEKQGIYMEIYENDKLLPAGEGKEFVAQAVKEMVQRNVGRIYQKE